MRFLSLVCECEINLSQSVNMRIKWFCSCYINIKAKSEKKKNDYSKRDIGNLFLDFQPFSSDNYASQLMAVNGTLSIITHQTDRETTWKIERQFRFVDKLYGLWYRNINRILTCNLLLNGWFTQKGRHVTVSFDSCDVSISTWIFTLIVIEMGKVYTGNYICRFHMLVDGTKVHTANVVNGKRIKWKTIVEGESDTLCQSDIIVNVDKFLVMHSESLI